MGMDDARQQLPPDEWVRCRGPNCEHIRKTSNHWWIVWSDGPGGMVHFVGYDRKMLEAVGVEQARTVCGNGCAQRMLEKFLSGEAI